MGKTTTNNPTHNPITPVTGANSVKKTITVNKNNEKIVQPLITKKVINEVSGNCEIINNSDANDDDMENPYPSTGNSGYGNYSGTSKKRPGSPINIEQVILDNVNNEHRYSQSLNKLEAKKKIKSGSNSNINENKNTQISSSNNNNNKTIVPIKYTEKDEGP
ncbi:putative uncharacterized protein DDB_G0286829 [Aphidius gifuensis]|uniref:putative uncharacterized protein DDB_G0286829 n=1 Tax=Aphidius gifuensis TaxID=684658 RepID=UPI001CDBD5DB|nr:putative uncharacterized protein DDB_G0286829 [Aphidius gifuensis]